MRTFILFLYIVAGVTGQGFSTTFLQNTLFGGDHSDFGVSSWSDQSRGVRYLVGQTYSTELSSPSNGENTLGAPDILLVKLDQATDSLIWYIVVGTSRSDQPRAITGDSEGNIWITGQTFGTFDNSDNSGVSRGFVMKLDSNGKTLQSMTIDTFQPTAIDSDLNGNIWIAGSATTSQSLNDENSNEDVAVIILSSTTGEQLTSQTFGGSASDIAKTIAVAKNTVAIGGITYSSDFPVTQGTRECEFCSGAGFVMTLTYDSTNGIKQSFSTYINGEESQSLSVVDITFDSKNNMYLSIFDDSNAMGAYIQQFKSDRTFGWVSEKSDAFWKVEYLPLIDALYTIGSFSTPTDYAVFYVMDTKTGSNIYSSKALTGALVDASVYALDENTVKISMVGTLQKELRITFHGRTYLTTHKSDDILIVSLTIRTLTAKTNQPSLAAHVSDTKSVASSRSLEERATLDGTCLYNRLNGFAPNTDLIYDTWNLNYYTLAPSSSSIILPYNPLNDYDDATVLGPFVQFDFGNAGRIARIKAGKWGSAFEAYLEFGFGTLPAWQNGQSNIVIDVPAVDACQIVLTNTGRSKNGDLVSWTVEVKFPALGAEASFNSSITLNPKIAAPLYLWVSYNGNVSSDNLAVYASTSSAKPSSTLLSFTFSADRLFHWKNSTNFWPKIASRSTIETLFSKASLCGFSTPITSVPIPLAPTLPITGKSNFPADNATGYDQAWIGQVIVLAEDSVKGTQTKFQFYKADGQPFQSGSAFAFVYLQPYTADPMMMKKKYQPNFFASTGVSGSGYLAGFVFGSQISFTKGTRYYFYISDGLTAQDNLYISDVSSIVSRRDTADPSLTYDKNTHQYVESNSSFVFGVASKPFANSDPLESEDPAPPTNRTDSDNSDVCTPGTEGCIVADPVFVGYNNQKFLFKGHAGQIYNLYNDPWINVNSLFGYANEKKKTGTVLHTIGVSIGQHNLFFDITNRENRRFFDVIIDGVTTRVGYNSLHLSGCVDLQYNTKVILITTPRHSIRLTIEWGHNWHINVPFFDLAIHHPEEDSTQIGGLLGQTAHEYKRDDIDMLEDDFKVSSIFSFEKSRYYNLQSIDC